MKIHKSTVKKRGQFPYDQFVSYHKGRAVKFKACLFDDLKGAFIKRDELGIMRNIYSPETDLNYWIEDIEDQIKELENEREFLLGVKELIGK